MTLLLARRCRLAIAIACAVGVVACSSVRLARAQAPRFGSRGQFVLSGDSSVGAWHDSYDSSDANGSTFAFSPGADFFVLPNVAIGFDGDASYVYTQSYGSDGGLVQFRTTYFGLGPRLGFNVPLGSVLSWFPRVTVGYETRSTLETASVGNSLSVPAPLGYPTTTESGPFVKVSAPLLLHVIPHFFFGLGPDFYRDFGSVSGGPNVGGQMTEFGFSLVVGAYWGGATAPESPTPPVVERPAPRFGAKGQFAVTNSIQASAYATSYAGTGSGSFGFDLAPAVSYFFVDHVSIGVGVEASYSHTKGIDAVSQATVVSTSSDRSLHLTVGNDIPFSRWVSLYPRVSLGAGDASYDEVSATENRDNEVYAYAEFFMPLLVHPSAHAFVGFGPDVTHDLTRSITFPTAPTAPAQQNRLTEVAATLIVGGWI